MDQSIAALIGKTLTAARKVSSERIEFVADDGSEYLMYHQQDCCESVIIEDIAGDLQDLVGSPILKAEESSSAEDPAGYAPPEYRESWTWTFYMLATVKGYVTIRWLGESNGYYSESAAFEQTKGMAHV